MTNLHNTTKMIFNRNFLLSTTSLVVIVLLLGHPSERNFVQSEPLEGGENVCTFTVPIKKDIKVMKPIEYEFKVQSMCGILPCTKIRKETRLDESIRTIIKHVERRTCCSGYTETPEKKCAPICLDSCNNGKCVSPNVCKCHPEPTDNVPGFVGSTCNRFTCLNSNKWGSKCDRDCNCTSANSYCSANTGKCSCFPGWRGENCTLECDSSSSHEPQCAGYLALPPIIEPDANVMDDVSNSARSAKLILPDALVLEEDKLKEPETDNRVNFWIASTLFSIICWASLVVYLIVVKRSKKSRDDPYYESCSGGSASSGGGYYSGSNYSQTTTGRSSASRSGNFLGKNLSMTAVIRNTLQGIDTEKNGQQGDGNRSKPIFAPIIETHLISSQKASQDNLYSEPIPRFERTDCRLYATPAFPSATSNNSEDHIYQVPKSPVHKPTIGPSNLEDALGQQPKQQHDNSMATIAELQDSSDDAVSNIYEELKPRMPEPR